MSSSEILKRLIDERRKSNHRVSLRALAKRMDIPSGRLSEILSGKRRLTEYYLERICTSLNLNESDTAELRQAHYKETYVAEKSASKDNYDTVLDVEKIAQIMNWKFFAILSLIQTEPYAAAAKEFPAAELQMDWITRKLNIPLVETSSLIHLMESFQYVKWEGQWIPLHNNATTGYDIPTKCIHDFHNNNLTLAKEKLATIDVKNRDYSSMTLTVDRDDLVKAKKMIRSFRRQFTTAMEKNKKKDVYQLAIQFFPLTEVGE